MNYENCGMNDVKIVNEELKGILNDISDIIQSIDPDLLRQIPREENAEDWCNEDYRRYIVSKGREHDGYPEMLLGAGITHSEFHYDGGDNLTLVSGMQERVANLCTWSGAHRNALCAVYPPGGFISWHTNANAGGYNVLFTWSQNGDGQWEHIQPNTGEHIVIPDVKGWQCKFGYYGTYDEPNFVLYHCAKTNCLRATIAFVFNADERGKSMAEMLIEDIQNA